MAERTDSAVVIVAGVLIAGGLGAVLRAALGQRLNRSIPWGTLAANLAAALALGLLADTTGRWVEVISIGLLGALSTWSSLAHEVVQLIEEKEYSVAAGYLGGTVTAGVGLAWIGLAL